MAVPEEEAPDFPPELDEFLEYCVAERAGDFEAISSDFLDIAAELEEPLAERAQEFFSPEALQQRWQLLSGEAASAANAEESFVAAGREQSPAPAAPSATPATPPPATGPTARETEEVEAPSGFSIFKDSLKDQIDKIYLDVQNNLPSAVGLGEEEDDSEEDTVGIDAASASIASCPVNLTRSPGSGDSPKAAPLAEAAPQPEARVGELPSGAALAGVGGDLRQRTMELFGTDDLNQIFSGMAKGPAVSADVPNFDAVLLSHGVNPEDIEGPLVQPPDIFRQLREGLAEAGPAEAPVPAEPQPQAPGHDPARLEPDGVGRPAAAAATGPASRRTREAAPGAAAAPPADAASEGSEASEDSADEDFAAMRRRAKSSSLEMVTTSEAADAPSSPTAGAWRPAFQPPPRTAPRAPVLPTPARRVKGKFVKLELVESSEEEEEEEDQEQSGSSSEATDPEDRPREGEEEQEAEPVRVLSRLMRKAPEGECAWDTWLDATRRWPRLQVALGSPEFFRRGDDLRVSFGTERLRALCEEQRQVRAERRRKRAEVAERLKTGVEEFVKEAERRREMMNGRFRGGFVLSSTLQMEDDLREHQQEAAAPKAPVAQQELQPQPQPQAAQDGGAQAGQQQRLVFRRPQPRPELEAERAKHREAREEAHRQREKAQEQAKMQQMREKAEEDEEAARRRQLAELAEIARQRRLPLFETQASVGPPLKGLSARGEALLDAASCPGAEPGCAIYALPWGEAEVGGGTYTAPTAEQRGAIGLLHLHNLTEAMQLVPAQVLASIGLLDAASGHPAAVLLLLGDPTGAGGEALRGRLASGRPLAEALIGPLPLPPLMALLRRPLALWALEDAARPPELASAPETLCVALRAGPGAGAEGALSAALEELEAEGLEVIGLRLAFPDTASARAVTSAALRSTVRAGQPVLLLGLRGPHALGLWRSLLGPADPVLARATDPSSLNARFGGQTRSEAVALAPPSSNARARADLAWAFGGRVDALRPEPPREPLHAAAVATPRTFAVRIEGRLSFGGAGALLSGLFLRLGRVLSLAADDGGALVATAVREGGGAFVRGCQRLLQAPPQDLVDGDVAAVGSPTRSSPLSCAAGLGGSGAGCDLEGVAAELCEVPRQCGLWLHAAPLPEAGPALEEACRLGEPEVLVVGLRAQGSQPAPLLLRAACEGVFAKFGPSALPGLGVGCGVDLLGVRALDFAALRAAAAAAQPTAETAAVCSQQAVFEAGLEALRAFQSFAQVVRRAPPEAVEGWWEPGEAGGPTTLLCLRGENLIGRFRNFLAKEWKLPAATAGDILFAPSPAAARRALHLFFAGRPGPPTFAPALPPGDRRSAQRFEPSVASATSPFAEDALFPRRLAPNLTAAVLLPPAVDSVLFRLLTAAEQQDFTLVAAAVAGGFSETMAQLLFEQELTDGHLHSEDREAFLQAVGSGPCADEDEGHFRCMWLIFSRHHAVKRLAQLCGHGDPLVNKQNAIAALRTGDRIQNGIRCASSHASAQALLDSLRPALAPLLVPPGAPGERRLGLEASAWSLGCSLCAAALVQASTLSAARLLRELHTALAERGLAAVGLRVLAPSVVGAEAEWPGTLSGWAELLESWHGTRPAAGRFVELAMGGCPFVMIACEGPLAADRTKAALAAVSAAAPKGALEAYASAGASEGVADVAYLFGELCGGKHYVVDCG